MATISETYELYEDYFIITAEGFTADNDATAFVDLKEKVGFIPSHFSLNVLRTGGATDLINASLQLSDPSLLSGTYAVSVTDSRGGAYTKSSKTHYNATNYLSELLLPTMRIIVITVGAGNTLTVTLIGRK